MMHLKGCSVGVGVIGCRVCTSVWLCLFLSLFEIECVYECTSLCGCECGCGCLTVHVLTCGRVSICVCVCVAS